MFHILGAPILFVPTLEITNICKCNLSPFEDTDLKKIMIRFQITLQYKKTSRFLIFHQPMLIKNNHKITK